MRLWKIHCMEDSYPGMWQRWFRRQCVGVGWKASWGYALDGPTDNHGWSQCRKILREITIGDRIVVALKGNRIARIGEITGKAVSDKDWDPLVPRSRTEPDGEMGRLIFVRWDLTSGPYNPDVVFQLPPERALSKGELRPTLSEIRSRSFDELIAIIKDTANWSSLQSRFDFERFLSDFIGTHPHYLEEGLSPYPSAKVREKVFKDKSRADVLLMDHSEQPVVVECKRDSPCVADIRQVRHYMSLLEKETAKQPRGMLVHGGRSIKLATDVREEASKKPPVEVVRYKLSVDFDHCS